MLQKIKERIFRHKFIAILIVAALAGGGYWFYQSSGKTQAATRYVLATAQKGTIISSVSGTGQVSSVKEVEVKPETSGTITSVNVSQGQEVKEGQIIAAIDPKNALVSLAQAKASLESAQASYDKLIAGATDDDLLSVRSSVDNAELSLNNAKSNLEQTKKDQQLKVEKAYTELMN